jgi:hypothetical protein
VIITPDLCLGVIEVKTELNTKKLRAAIRKLAYCRSYISRPVQRPRSQDFFRSSTLAKIFSHCSTNSKQRQQGQAIGF